MQLARSLQKMKLKCHNNAAFSQPFWLFRGKNKEAGSLHSRAGRCKQDYTSAMLSFCTNWPTHQNRKENVKKNVKPKPFPTPTMVPKFWSGGNHYLKMCVFEISVKVCALMFPWYFHYSIGSTGRIYRREVIEALTVLIHVDC